MIGRREVYPDQPRWFVTMVITAVGFEFLEHSTAGYLAKIGAAVFTCYVAAGVEMLRSSHWDQVYFDWRIRNWRSSVHNDRVTPRKERRG